jgi:hypothetical protein
LIRRARAAGGVGLKRRGIAECAKIQNLISDPDAAAKRLVAGAAAKYRKRQILDRKVAALGIGGCQPAAARRVVGRIG